jgi:hypothetical protein
MSLGRADEPTEYLSNPTDIYLSEPTNKMNKNKVLKVSCVDEILCCEEIKKFGELFKRRDSCLTRLGSVTPSFFRPSVEYESWRYRMSELIVLGLLYYADIIREKCLQEYSMNSNASICSIILNLAWYIGVKLYDQ